MSRYIDYVGALTRLGIRALIAKAFKEPLPYPVLRAEGGALDADSGTCTSASTILTNLKHARDRGFRAEACRLLVFHAVQDIIIPPGYYAAALGQPTPYGQSTHYGVPGQLDPSVLPVFPSATGRLFRGTSSRPQSSAEVAGGHGFLEEPELALCGVTLQLGLIPAILDDVEQWANNEPRLNPAGSPAHVGGVSP